MVLGPSSFKSRLRLEGKSEDSCQPDVVSWRTWSKVLSHGIQLDHHMRDTGFAFDGGSKSLVVDGCLREKHQGPMTRPILLEQAGADGLQGDTARISFFQGSAGTRTSAVIAPINCGKELGVSRKPVSRCYPQNEPRVGVSDLEVVYLAR
jgi:hypothetical protein